jgi:hypothetical protein
MREATSKAFQLAVHWLPVVLFAAAYLHDQQMPDARYLPTAQGVVNAFHAGLLAWLRTHPFPVIQWLGWVVFLGSLALLMLAPIILVHDTLLWWDMHRDGWPLLYGAGLLCLLPGVVFGASLLLGTPLLVLNPFWYLGLLCYGVDLCMSGAMLRHVEFS